MQGIYEPSLRYIACRVAQELCTVLGEKAMDFKKPLFVRYYYSSYKIKIKMFPFFNRLQAWYKVWKERFDTEPLTDDRKYHFINLSLFYAEMFVRVKVVS